MHFGVCLPNFPFGAPPSRDHIVAIAQAAERLHYASVWVSDHVLVPVDKPRYGHLYEVLTTLAYIAGVTERIRLGTSVLVLPQRDAILAAKQIATLDDLSGGRVIVGVGAGWMEGEFTNLGADFHRRGRHLDEGIQVMHTLWRDQTPQHAGSFYRFTDVLFGPKPSQAGGPAIWIGGASDAALRRAALLGDGWHADDVPLEQLHTIVARSARSPRSSSAVLRCRCDAPSMCARQQPLQAFYLRPPQAAVYTLDAGPEVAQERSLARWRTSTVSWTAWRTSACPTSSASLNTPRQRNILPSWSGWRVKFSPATADEGVLRMLAFCRFISAPRSYTTSLPS